jgi:hypothetical protein
MTLVLKCQEAEFEAFQLVADVWVPKRASLAVWQTRISGFVSYNCGTAVPHRTIHDSQPNDGCFREMGGKRRRLALILRALHCLHPDLDLVCAFRRRLS